MAFAFELALYHSCSMIPSGLNRLFSLRVRASEKSFSKEGRGLCD